MPDLLLRDLASITGGRLRLADLPPLQGDLEAIGHIDFDVKALTPGGLYWDLGHSRTAAFAKCQLAFLKGAAGILTAAAVVEPWSGRYALQVATSQLALRHFSYFLKDQRGQQHVAVCQGPVSRYTLAALAKVTCGSPYLPASPGTPSGHRTSFPLSEQQPITFLINDLSAAFVPATLLLAAPQLLLLDRAGTIALQKLGKGPLHRLVEALLPEGLILYCDLPASPPAGTDQAPHRSSPPTCLQFCQQAGLRVFHLGPGKGADFQLLHAAVAGTPPHLQIDGFRLPYTTRTFTTRLADATAYVAARLLGYSATIAAARLDFPPCCSRQLVPSPLASSQTTCEVPATPPHLLE